jgi:hypothetical protein
MMRMPVRVAVMVGRTVVAVLPRNRFGRGQDKPPRLDPLGADQVIGQVADFEGGSAQQDDFQASLLVEMHVRRRDDPIEMMVLQVGQAASDPRHMMVINERDDPHGLAIVASDCFFDKRIPHQPAHGLATVGVAVHLAILVESLEKFTADRHAEPDEMVFQGNVLN